MSRINIRGPLCSTSYGLSVLNVIKSLSEIGHEVSAFPIGQLDGNDIPEQFHPSLRAALQNASLWDVEAPSVTIYHQFALAESVGRKRIGWPIFELDTFNDIELHHLRSLDQIIVCSQWAKQVCLDNGLTQRIDVVPLGVDPTLFVRKPTEGRFVLEYDRQNSASFAPAYVKREIDQNATVFISVAKKEYRKYHDGLIRCFEKAFTNTDNVELWMIWGNRILQYKNPEENLKWTQYYENTRLRGKVRLFEWLPKQENVVDLMQKSDCFVGVSRAEGWNLPLLEAMALGMQVITNDYSGHTEFATSKNSHLIPFRQKEVANDGIWFHGQGQWMAIDKPEEDLIVANMRKIHNMKQQGVNMYNNAGVETARQFTWENTAKRLMEAVS